MEGDMRIGVGVGGLVLVVVGTAQAAEPSKDEMIRSAEAAAPAAVAKGATVIAMDEKMNVTVLREGKNGWTCMPDSPASPGHDPMCLDKGGMAWAEAWIGHKEPDHAMMGFGYMLEGGSDASNTDPYAMEPASGAAWVDTGPHVMVFNAGAAAKDYPRQGEGQDTSVPYVMWPGTPYEHLMIPVK
jgi:hypothetical protein